MEATLLAGDVGRFDVTGLAPEEGWRSAAACHDTDPDLFFPVSGSGKSLEQIERAKAICAGCVVQQSCLAFALRTGQAHGVWGGRTEEERRQLGPAATGVRPARASDRPAVRTSAAWKGTPIGGPVRASRDAGGGMTRDGMTRDGMTRDGMTRDGMTEARLRALGDRIEEASRMPSQPGWGRKAAAYAGTFRLLAEVSGNRAPGGAAGLVRDLMTDVGPGANGMIVSAHRRVLAYLRAGHAEQAARELASHLSALHYMWRLSGARRGNAESAAAGEAVGGCASPAR